MDAPVVFDLDRAMQGGAAYEWEPQHGLRLGVMPFDRPAEIRWYEAPDTGFSFHTYNAWREGGCTVLLCGRKERMDFDGAPTDRPEMLWRYRIDPVRGTVTSEQLDDLHAVLPRIDDRRTGRPTRFGYATTILGHDRMIDWDAVVQFDLQSGARKTYQWPAGSIGGEPVFAPDPGRGSELDGWVLQLVQDPARGATDLCVLDAANIEAGPVARVHLPRTAPNGFHGSWLPG
jgi:carotenoid cleavage dioxygenase